MDLNNSLYPSIRRFLHIAGCTTCLKKGRGQITDLSHFGVAVLSDYAQIDLAVLAEQIDEDLLVLNAAHLERYGLAPDFD